MQQQNLFDNLSYVFAQIHKKEQQVIQLKNLLHTSGISSEFNIFIDGICIQNDIIPYNLKTEIRLILADSILLLEREIQSLKIQFVC
jgi:hypothetical protein